MFRANLNHILAVRPYLLIYMDDKNRRQKTGGRQKGTPNKITTDIRQRYRDFIVENFEAFESAWREVEDPKDKADLYIKASKFVVPALQSVDMNASMDKDKSIEAELEKLAE